MLYGRSWLGVSTPFYWLSGHARTYEIRLNITLPARDQSTVYICRITAKSSEEKGMLDDPWYWNSRHTCWLAGI